MTGRDDSNRDGSKRDDTLATSDDAPTDQPPVECTLDGAAIDRRREWARSDLLSHLAAFEWRGDGFVATFDGSGEALQAVAEFVRRESGCCSWADFRVDYERPHDETRLRVTGPDGAADLFAEGLAEAFDEIPARP